MPNGFPFNTQSLLGELLAFLFTFLAGSVAPRWVAAQIGDMVLQTRTEMSGCF